MGTRKPWFVAKSFQVVQRVIPSHEKYLRFLSHTLTLVPVAETTYVTALGFDVMKEGFQVFAALFFAFLAGVGIMYQAKPELFTRIEVRQDTVRTELSQAILDSLQLAFSVSVKPEVVTVVKMTKDSSFARQLIDEIFALREQLRNRGEITLHYQNYNLGPYGDTLIAKADFVVEKIMVDFHPKARTITVSEVDTLQSSTFVQSGIPWYVTVIAFLLGLALGLL